MRIKEVQFLPDERAVTIAALSAYITDIRASSRKTNADQIALARQEIIARGLIRTLERV